MQCFFKVNLIIYSFTELIHLKEIDIIIIFYFSRVKTVEEEKTQKKEHYEKKTMLDQNHIKRQMIEWTEESRNDQREEWKDTIENEKMI